MTRFLAIGLSVISLCALAYLPTAQAQADRDAEARGLFDAGQSAYEAGRFADAERYFRQSYELSGRAELLYNIALSAEQARHDEAAIEAYRTFLEALPSSDRASRARTRLEALERMMASGGRDAGGETDGGGSGSAGTGGAGTGGAGTGGAGSGGTGSGGGGSGGGGPSIGGIILLAAGGAAAIAGAVLVGLAAADVASVENADVGTPWANVSDAYGRSEGLSIAGFVLLGVGVAAAAVGVVLLAMGGSDDEASANLRLGPGSLSLEGSF